MYQQHNEWIQFKSLRWSNKSGFSLTKPKMVEAYSYNCLESEALHIFPNASINEKQHIADSLLQVFVLRLLINFFF